MFKLDENQLKKLDAWKKEVQAKGIEKQKTEVKADDIYEMCWKMGYPYTGMIGGTFTFSFTPTSVGVVVKVTDAITEEEIDLTDYDSW